MIEIGVASNTVAGVVLLAVSLFAFIVGTIFRKWPEKVQERAEGFDGLAYFLTPEAHRIFIEVTGTALVLTSFAALLAGAVVL